MAFDWSIGFSAKTRLFFRLFFVFNWVSFDTKQHCIAVSCKMHVALSVHEHFQKAAQMIMELSREIIETNCKATSDESVLDND